MRTYESLNRSRPRQRPIIREENPMYAGFDNGAVPLSDLSRQRQQTYVELEPDYDEDGIFEHGSSVDNTRLEYDYAMEDLLQQLPSRQLENVAESASRALWRKRLGASAGRGTMRIHKDDAVQDEIVGTIEQELENDDQLFDDLDAAVRTLPTTLTKKRTIKKRLSRKEKQHLARRKLMKYWFSTQWQQTKYKITKEIRLDLWGSHLKVIEGCFGTSVVSYFIFLKWVLLINIPIFLLTFSFLVLPQILYRYYERDSSNITVSQRDFTGIEILTGTGYFENSEMYYGFYTSETVEIISGHKYEMKYAYLLTCTGYYLFCLIILGYSYLRSYRKYHIEASGSLRRYYFSLAFCGWDYGITSEETSQLKHQSIYNEFKEYLAGINTVIPVLTRRKKVKKWLIRLLVWTVVLALLCVSGYVTYLVSTELSIQPYLANSTMPLEGSLVMPFVLSSIQLIIPMVFSFLEAYEQFSLPKYELYVHLFREQVLRAAMLAVLVYFWLQVASSKIQCWETFVGQELYRLTVMDAIFGLLYSFFMEFIRKLCSLKWKTVQRPEFAIARHTLELVYTQSLCWLGIFYAPLLPVVVIVKLVITFYVKRYSVMQNCRPSLKPWRASRTHTLFVGYIFLFFILTCIAVFFGIFESEPSKVCGPYQSYETSYEVVRQLVLMWENSYPVISQIISFVNSPGFVAGVLIFLCVVVYYSRAIMLSRKHRVEMFKTQLLSEGKDKKFLLNLLNHIKTRDSIVERDRPGPSTEGAMQSDEPFDQRDSKIFIRTAAEGRRTGVWNEM